MVWTIAVDFDGVLHPYDDSIGKITAFKPPIKGAKEALDYLYEQDYYIIIHTCRAKIGGIKKWLRKHKIPYHWINENPYAPEDCNPRKLFADVYIDDRAIRFKNWGQTIKDIKDLEKV